MGPDLSTLPQRMRYAADVIEEAEARADREPVIRVQNVSPSDLRTFADIWEAQDGELVEDLARDIGEHIYRIDTPNPRMLEMFRRQARYLIGAGWRKDAESG